MDTDPYFWTQDNGAGAPVHFATTYKQLDMVRRARRDETPLPPSCCARELRRLAALTRCASCAGRAPDACGCPCAAQLHHIIRNFRETVNQRDPRGLTALHRAAFLAQYDGYLQIYEYLLVRARAGAQRAAALASRPSAFRALTRAVAAGRAERGR